MQAIECRCLGQIHVNVCRAGTDDVHAAVINHFPTDKVRALLAYLILEHDRAHSRRTLAALLWPEQGESLALGNLRHSLHRLRVTLDKAEPRLSEQVLTITRQTVRANAGAISVDVVEFEALLYATTAHAHGGLAECDSCLAQLEQAVALYQGDLLSGLSIPDAPAFEEWLALRREALFHKALIALDELTSAFAAQGNLTKTQTYAMRQLQLDPFQQEAHRHVMRILAQRGLATQAVAHYEELQRLLQSEMNIAPDVETQNLHAAIMNGNLADEAMPPAPTRPAPLAPPEPHPRGSEVPIVGAFYGRHYELARLEQWLVTNGARLVAILGMGGLGKTALAAQAAKGLAAHFEAVFWFSLVNAPPLSQLMPTLLNGLVRQQLHVLPDALDEQLALLLVYLRRRRVLIILDNYESVLDPTRAGRYRSGYESYEQLLREVAWRQHRSALMLTSREQPVEVGRLEGDLPIVRSLHLEGLNEDAGHDLLAGRGIRGPANAEASLIARYSGNPLALKLVADTIDSLFVGDVEAFLSEDTLVFDDMRTMLDQQMRRLSESEQATLFWLAIERVPVDVATLRRELLGPNAGRTLLESLTALNKRSLVERVSNGFVLQSVVTEYLTDRLVDAARSEILSGQLNLLHRHALIKADARDDVRTSQARLLVAPLIAQLHAALGNEGLIAQLQTLLVQLHTEEHTRPSYAAGNLLNLLLHLGVDVSGYDFSQLCVWQADLRGVTLTNVNMAGADLSHTAFTEAFGRIYALAFHPQGRFVAAGVTQGNVRLWSCPEGHSMGLLAGHRNPVMSVAFSPAGNLLASGSLDGTVAVWEWRSGRCRRVLQHPEGGILAVAFSADGTLLASGGLDNIVRVWDVETGGLVAQATKHAKAVSAVAFHPTANILATASYDHTVCLWDVASLKERRPGTTIDAPLCCLSTLHAHAHWVLSLAFHPDGSILATAGADTRIQLWNTNTYENIGQLPGHTHWVRSLAFTPDGTQLISGGADRFIRIWNLRQRRIESVLGGHVHVIRTLAVHPEGRYIASGGLDDMVQLRELDSSQAEEAVRTIRGHVVAIHSIVFSPGENELITGDGKGWVRCWPQDKLGDVDPTPRILPGRGMQVNHVTFSADGKWLAAADDDATVRLWNLAHPTEPALLHGHNAAVHVTRFTTLGDRLLTAGYEGDIYIWETRDPYDARLHDVLSGHTREIYGLVLTPDDKYVISGATDGTIRVWDLAARRCIQVVENGHCRALALGADSTMLAAAGEDAVVKLYQLTPQIRLVPHMNIKAHSMKINTLAFAPDGMQVASAGDGGNIRIWDVATGCMSMEFAGHEQPVRTLAFQDNGRILASGSEDETVRYWDVNCDALQGQCVRVLRIPGPYAQMNITGATGISPAQRQTLLALGAVDYDNPPAT